MYFNPSKLIWEGNDVELKKFETLNTKTPGLIAYISNKGAVQVVGDMMFDPEKGCVGSMLKKTTMIHLQAWKI